ncbi:MAG: Fur family transcriptional regulator [Bacteroidaceae bacterium]|jgi:Fur family ferric uptake transcriptional regulator
METKRTKGTPSLDEETWIHFLRQKGLRKTPERLALCEAALATDGHFTAEDLYEFLQGEARFRVSRATVYSNLQLLVEAGLLVRHQFSSSSSAVYERMDRACGHFHQICTGCGTVTERDDSRLRNQIREMHLARFHISSYSLYIYGMCSRCKRQMMQKNKTSKNKKNKQE